MEKVIIGLGGNIGDVKSNLARAINLIEKQVGELEATSSFIKTKAWGKEDQPDFLNAVIQIKTIFSPASLLLKLLKIEKEIGRNRHNAKKWGPRIIDLDILFYGQAIIDSKKLTVPHPYITSREFVMKPLAEICPEFKHPVLNKTIHQLTESNG